MFIIFNKDGSIFSQTQSDFVMQGSNRVNKVFVGFVDNEYSNWSCSGAFNLPNGTRFTIPGVQTQEGFEYLGNKYYGWVIELTNDITMYSGNVALTVMVVSQNTNVLFTYLANITINETGFPLDGFWDSSITVAQFNDYMAQLAVKLQANTVSVVVRENELPAVGTKNVLYFIIGETSDTPYQVKMWNGSEYTLLGTINLSSFASKEEQLQFEAEINAQVEQIRGEVINPFVVVDTISQLPLSNQNKLYIVAENNSWYYWNGSEYIIGGNFVEAGLTNEEITDYTSLNQTFYQYILTRYTNGDHRPFFMNIESVANWVGSQEQVLPEGRAFCWYDVTSGDIIVITNGGISAIDNTYETRPIVNYNSLAERVIYDNSNSGLEATDVQGAIDETNQVITNKINKYFKNINLFNPETATSGAFLQASGVPMVAASYYYSDFIPVEVGQTYTWKFHEGTKGVAYNGNKEVVLGITTSNTVTSDSYSSFTVPSGVSYIRVNGRAIPKESQMVIKGTIEEYPQIYIPYGTELVNIKLGGELKSEINELITEKVPGTETIQSQNLLDLSKVEWGVYLNADGSTGTYNGGGVSDYIPIDVTKSYMFPVNTAFYGSASVNIQLYDKNKTRVGSLMGASTGVSIVDFTSEDYGTYKVFITGVLNSRAEFIDAKYARITAFNNVPPYATGHVSKFMMVEGNDINQYPRTFQKYEYYKVLDNVYSLNDTQIAKVEELVTQNVLNGKKILFDGDSICEATSAGVNDGGWAKRIGEANHMIWYNHGVSGGTIADIPGDRDRHIISTSWQRYPVDLDYIVLEGGTNDADNINGDEALIGTFSMTDWSGNYDYTTFCGAMEYMFYNIQQRYPHAKIAYIVAQRMGYSSTSNCNYSTGTPRYDIFILAMQICKKWGIPFINLWDESGFNPMLSAQYLKGATKEENEQHGSLYTDGQHLTAAGYDKLTTQIDAFIKSI